MIFRFNQMEIEAIESINLDYNDKHNTMGIGTNP